MWYIPHSREYLLLFEADSCFKDLDNASAYKITIEYRCLRGRIWFSLSPQKLVQQENRKKKSSFLFFLFYKFIYFYFWLLGVRRLLIAVAPPAAEHGL